MRKTISLFFLLLMTLRPIESGFAQNGTAEQMDVQARAYYRAGAFKQAAEAFQKAYELEAKSGRLFNAARAYEQAGEKRKASEFFARFLAVESTGDKVTEARARKAKLDTVIAEEDKAAEVSAAQNARVEQARKHADSGQEHLRSQSYVEAAAAFEAAFQANGDAEFVYEKAEALRLGKQRAEAIAAYIRYQREAPNGRNLDLARARQRELERESNEPREGATDTSKPLADSATTSIGSKPRDEGNGTMRTTGIVGMGLGLAMVGVAGVFALDARGKESELEGLSAMDMEFWDQALYEDGKASANTALGVGLLGGAILTGGVVLYVLGRGGDEKPKQHVSIAPIIGDDGAGFALGGHF